MDQIQISYQEALMLGAAIGALVGFILGQIVFFLALSRGKRQLAVVGLLLTIVGGAVSPIIALIIVDIFAWVIFKKPNTSLSASSDRVPPADPT